MVTGKPTLKVLKYGDPIFRQIIKEASDFTNLSYLIEQMLNTMKEESGI